MCNRLQRYYQARGFSTYYLANAVYNIVIDSASYIRGIEEILGDMQTVRFMQPFKKETNLHEFIRCIALEIFFEEDNDLSLIRRFIQIYEINVPNSSLESLDSISIYMIEDDQFDRALSELADEVFHVLFPDVMFQKQFNQLCADYIETSGYGEELKNKNGTLKRVRVPDWAKKAVFYRDRGECRTCKRSLTVVINQYEKAHYDHIVPLARFGANDVTNLQLLCEKCNLEKSASEPEVSPLYQRAIPS